MRFKAARCSTRTSRAAPRPTWRSTSRRRRAGSGNACLQFHGGFGFAHEYDVERKFRETRLYQVAPISTNLDPQLRRRAPARAAALVLMAPRPA
jgi:hypothetical protein